MTRPKKTWIDYVLTAVGDLGEGDLGRGIYRLEEAVSNAIRQSLDEKGQRAVGPPVEMVRAFSRLFNPPAKHAVEAWTLARAVRNLKIPGGPELYDVCWRLSAELSAILMGIEGAHCADDKRWTTIFPRVNEALSEPLVIPNATSGKYPIALPGDTGARMGVRIHAEISEAALRTIGRRLDVGLLEMCRGEYPSAMSELKGAFAVFMLDAIRVGSQDGRSGRPPRFGGLEPERDYSAIKQRYLCFPRLPFPEYLAILEGWCREWRGYQAHASVRRPGPLMSPNMYWIAWAGLTAYMVKAGADTAKSALAVVGFRSSELVVFPPSAGDYQAIRSGAVGLGVWERPQRTVAAPEVAMTEPTRERSDGDRAVPPVDSLQVVTPETLPTTLACSRCGWRGGSNAVMSLPNGNIPMLVVPKRVESVAEAIATATCQMCLGREGPVERGIEKVLMDLGIRTELEIAMIASARARNQRRRIEPNLDPMLAVGTRKDRSRPSLAGVRIVPPVGQPARPTTQEPRRSDRPKPPRVHKPPPVDRQDREGVLATCREAIHEQHSLELYLHPCDPDHSYRDAHVVPISITTPRIGGPGLVVTDFETGERRVFSIGSIWFVRVGV